MDTARKISTYFEIKYFQDLILKLRLQGWTKFELFQKRQGSLSPCEEALLKGLKAFSSLAAFQHGI